MTAAAGTAPIVPMAPGGPEDAPEDAPHVAPQDASEHGEAP
jgi:hypothetical protein